MMPFQHTFGFIALWTMGFVKLVENLQGRSLLMNLKIYYMIVILLLNYQPLIHAIKELIHQSQ
jgi:hypothetical protein